MDKYKIIINRKENFICPECDAVWIDVVDEKHITNFDKYVEANNITNLCDEIQIIE